MKQLRSNKIKLTVFGVVFCSSFALLPLQARQISETLNNDQKSSEMVIMISGEEHRYQPRPDLGYVIMAQENADTITSVKSNFDLFTRQEVKYIGGRGRQGLRIVESMQSATPNKAAIKTLSAQKQFQYVAPLFSCNGSKIAVIPEVVVRVTYGIREDQLQSLCREIGCAIIKPMEFTTQEYLLGVMGPDAGAVFAAVQALNEQESIEWAWPNLIHYRDPDPVVVSEDSLSLTSTMQSISDVTDSHAYMEPNDEYFSNQWHLHNTGQGEGTPGADINALAAWEITTGDPNIVVAVIDSGVDLDHPDLVNNLVPGYDFWDDDDWPQPLSNTENAHGTCCAGLISAQGNNGIGVVGVAWNCKLMPIRVDMWPGRISGIEEERIATSFRWAAANGADVLSNSWGFGNPLPIIHSAIIDITKTGGIGRDGKGCIVVFAGGNGGKEGFPYPVRYPEVITVGSTDNSDVHWYYSNYGPELDIVAPSGPSGSSEAGMHIWTTDITGNEGFNMYNKDPSILDYCDFGGTSGACPVAAGIAALILSIEPELTNEEVRHFLEQSAKDLGDPGRDDYYGWGRVDARAALDMVLAKRCDLNNDWKVDEQDLAILNAAIDTNDLSADIAPQVKRDGIVDEQDLELMMQYWGTEIPEMPEPGLIAHWKLDEKEGMFASDSVGGNDAIVLGGFEWQPSGGQIDGALMLNGVDVCAITEPVLNPADGPLSIFTWIKDGAAGQVVLSQQGSENWFMADSIDGALQTNLRTPATGGRNPKPPGPPLVCTTVITDGNWHHIGFVWDGSCRHIYVDGVEVASDVEPLSGLNDAYGGLYIGCGKSMEPDTFFSGLIDDVRIYNRAVKP